MKPDQALILAALVWGGLRTGLTALESEPVSRPGIRNVQFVTDAPAIVPGRPFTVGLRLEPMPEHHTYWRGPGIVGVATRIDWTLPEGFKAGPLLWPPPSHVLMAGIAANGFKKPVLLLTEITPPEQIDAKEFVLAGRVSWMACAVSCNPGVADLSLTLPVAVEGATVKGDAAIAEAFAAAREASPKAAPADWRFEARLAAPDRIELIATVPGITEAQAKSVEFFCDDMQVDSDEPQIVEVLDASATKFKLSLSRPEFAPKQPVKLSGVLHCPGGWPGTGSAFVELSAPWPGGTFPE
jgi:DsbC/DsbD-like thiol-disulfide interchange protein